MKFSGNIEPYDSLYLKDYADFVLLNKLEDFVSLYMINIHTFNIPLIQYFSHFSQEQLLSSGRENIKKLLAGIKNGTAIEDVLATLNDWRYNRISDIPREALSLKDITLIYSAQKLSFQSFLPYYTNDVAAATQVMNELEFFYKHVQEVAFEMVELVRREEHDKRVESEEKYRDLFDNATDLIYIADPAGKIQYVNNAWLESLGYEVKHLTGKQIDNFIQVGELQEFRNVHKKMIEEQTSSINIRTTFIKSNADEVIVEGFISGKFEDGVLKYTRALFHDVTPKLKQEEQIRFYTQQLAERERNLSDVIENAPDGVIVIDKENNIVLWNPKSQAIFGWTKEEVTGKKITDTIVPVEFREAHSRGLQRLIETKQPRILNQTVEVPAVNKNGHQFYISLTVSHSTQNEKDLFIAFLRDISDQKRNELELENKRKQLEKSNQELEQYAWLTSHDLKEPLRKILTFSDALLKKEDLMLPPLAGNYLQKIHSSAFRMKGLIEAVLIYSNVANDNDLFVPTNLNQILAGVLEDLEITITSKSATIIYDELPVIEAIPIQMTQLFQNLISNSIKYSKPNVPPAITISCNEENGGTTIVFEDNGIGFEKMYASKIFQVFQRLHTKSFEGTGIGLALCKKIIETHKGDIYAESEPDIGSTFTVYLPKKHRPVSSPAA